MIMSVSAKPFIEKKFINNETFTYYFLGQCNPFLAKATSDAMIAAAHTPSLPHHPVSAPLLAPPVFAPTTYPRAPAYTCVLTTPPPHIPSLLMAVTSPWLGTWVMSPNLTRT